MDNRIFNAMEIDAIGEIMNISIGSSATAISSLLNRRVDITTPKISILDKENFTIDQFEACIGVEVSYIAGLSGSNIMILKQEDVSSIVDILLGTETSASEFTLDEMTVSAICEVMNQMMGAASTAISDFLGKMINISPPRPFVLDDFESFKQEYYPEDDGALVLVRFEISIEGVLHSEFFNIITVLLARNLIGDFGLEALADFDGPADFDPWVDPITGERYDEDDFSDLPTANNAASVTAASKGRPLADQNKPTKAGASTAPEDAATDGGKLSQEGTEGQMQENNNSFESDANTEHTSEITETEPVEIDTQAEAESGSGMETYVAPEKPVSSYPPSGSGYPYPPDPMRGQKLINTQPVQLPQLDLSEHLNQEQTQNLELIMSVPLEVSVEIGRTQRKIQEILSLSKGSLIVLDRLAGDQVDLFVNGQCIAKGDVVVVDDNFGIRITEIMKAPDTIDFFNF